jgi:hypothetical protein
MSIDAFLTDPKSKSKSRVTDDGELSVISASYPPLEPQKVETFRQYITDDGLSTGTISMSVDGSTANVDYFIKSDPTSDRYISTISFILGYGTSGQPNQWGDGTALTNGVRIFYRSERGEIDIHDGIKTNQDFFRLSFYPIPTAWEVRHVNATNDWL